MKDKVKFERIKQKTLYPFQHIGFISIDGIAYVYDLETLEVMNLDDETIQKEAKKFLRCMEKENFRGGSECLH